jgi:uncharacterized OB-fold protein
MTRTASREVSDTVTEPAVEPGGASSGPPAVVPYVEYLVLGDYPKDEPYLVANRCTSCQALFLDRRNACARCGARVFEAVPLARTGVIRAFTIVHRAMPDVKVPYISVIVDLDGGGTVKGNLVGVATEPGAVPMGGPVRLTTQSAGRDSAGTEAIAFAFTMADGNQPAGPNAGDGND